MMGVHGAVGRVQHYVPAPRSAGEEQHVFRGEIHSARLTVHSSGVKVTSQIRKWSQHVRQEFVITVVLSLLNPYRKGR